MTFDIQQLCQTNAEIIANEWKYPDVYAFYNMTSDPEDYEEITTPHLRKDNYFQVNLDNQLFGFFVVEHAQDNHNTVEIGLGIKPDSTGNGLGYDFVLKILDYIRENYSAKTVRLAVASFNKRALKVYEKAGFMQTRVYEQQTNGSVYEFVEMEKKI